MNNVEPPPSLPHNLQQGVHAAATLLRIRLERGGYWKCGDHRDPRIPILYLADQVGCGTAQPHLIRAGSVLKSIGYQFRHGQHGVIEHLATAAELVQGADQCNSGSRCYIGGTAGPAPQNSSGSVRRGRGHQGHRRPPRAAYRPRATRRCRPRPGRRQVLSSVSARGLAWVNSRIRSAAVNKNGAITETSTVIAAGTRPPNRSACDERKPLVRRSLVSSRVVASGPSGPRQRWTAVPVRLPARRPGNEAATEWTRLCSRLYARSTTRRCAVRVDPVSGAG